MLRHYLHLSAAAAPPHLPGGHAGGVVLPSPPSSLSPASVPPSTPRAPHPGGSSERLPPPPRAIDRLRGGGSPRAAPDSVTFTWAMSSSASASKDAVDLTADGDVDLAATATGSSPSAKRRRTPSSSVSASKDAVDLTADYDVDLAAANGAPAARAVTTAAVLARLASIAANTVTQLLRRDVPGLLCANLAHTSFTGTLGPCPAWTLTTTVLGFPQQL